MKKKTRLESKRDAQINRAYMQACSGIQIDIMDINKVFAEGHRLLEAGADDEQLRGGLLVFALSISKGLSP